jgi:hypothetical protein
MEHVVPHPPRWLPWLAGGSVVCAVVVLFGVWPLSGHDFLMHLSVGQWTWRHGWVPLADDFSYTSAGERFIAHSWLAEVMFYLVTEHTQTVGQMLLRFTLLGLALTFSLSAARMLKAPWPAIMLVAPFVLGVMWARVEMRPQLFTTALLAAELWLLISVHTGCRSWRWLWALPPMGALWVNLHGGWPQGLATVCVVSGAVLVTHYRRRVLGRRAITHLPPRHLALVLAAGVVALFINPYGWRLMVFPNRYAVNMVTHPLVALDNIPLLGSLGYELIHTDQRCYLMLRCTPETEAFTRQQTESPRPLCRDAAYSATTP